MPDILQFIDIGCIEYRHFLTFQDKLHVRAQRDARNYVVFASHHKIFTKGANEKRYPFALPVDRGGSITYFDEGSFMIYFIVKVEKPRLFFKKVIAFLKQFFCAISKKIYYDTKKTGFYIENKKLCSLGFCYKNGYSKHGVSIHYKNNLDIFNLIDPCSLRGVRATTLDNEGFVCNRHEIKSNIQACIQEVFV